MISTQLLLKVDSILKQMTGNFQSNFGGLDIILIGDLRQLSPVRSTPIYKQPKQTIIGLILWRNLNFYELNKVMRQANQKISSIFTKIGNGEQLDCKESRSCTVEEAEARCPQDGLANSIVRKLVHVETNDEGLVKTIWLEFLDLPRIGGKLRRKAANYAAEINV
ncbi:ATP-dependent DNA helicase [Trichonephila clavata]|uniref:ATP-dependent DNA helicase n=1 Tax=Trichonephila clavata TaxID=2740835 RepID=A0A8X6JJL4_TRICU|nr:ATP-dependent DNA helicase [Trichonephila clavata]